MTSVLSSGVDSSESSPPMARRIRRRAGSQSLLPVAGVARVGGRRALVEAVEHVLALRIAESQVARPGSGGDGRAIHGHGHTGLAAKARGDTGLRFASQQVDAPHPRAGAHTVLVGDTDDDDGQQAQRLGDRHLDDHAIVLEPRVHQDRGEEPQLIEAALIRLQRGAAKRLSDTGGQVPLHRIGRQMTQPGDPDLCDGQALQRIRGLSQRRMRVDSAGGADQHEAGQTSGHDLLFGRID